MDPSPYRFMLSVSRGVNEPMTSLPAQRGGGWMVTGDLSVSLLDVRACRIYRMVDQDTTMGSVVYLGVT